MLFRSTAVAAEPGAIVLAVGAKPDAPFVPSAWELAFRAAALEPGAAVALYEHELPGYPESAALRYNLACLQLRAGRRDAGLESLRRAVELDRDMVRRWAEGDGDLDSVRPEVAQLLSS